MLKPIVDLNRIAYSIRRGRPARLLVAFAALFCLTATSCPITTTDPPNPFPLPNGGILVIIDNQSGVDIRVDAVFENLGAVVRSTTLLLATQDPHRVDEILITVADEFHVVARVNEDASGLPAGIQPSQVLLDRTFVLGVDYHDGDTIGIVIPPLTPVGQGTDCNENGILDAVELANDPDLDCDESGVLDVCETDTDSDGVIDACDACPTDATNDSDGDGVCDSEDECPGSNDAADADGDGKADGCDPCPADASDDSDGDGVCDSADQCPGHDDTLDADSDGAADGCDGCPNDAAKSAPGVCGCGVAEDAGDGDEDGVPNCLDICPGGDDNADGDEDGIADFCDICPKDNPDDTDGDGVCDSADVCEGHDDNQDRDQDGVPDDCDGCPDDSEKSEPGVCGCGVAEDAGDSDEDNVPNCLDICPGGNDHLDTDEDGVPNYCDVCPDDNPDDIDGDGVCDSNDACPGHDDNQDRDQDGTPDDCDGCPDDSNKTEPGVCGCGVIEDVGDDDEDGVPNCLDQCAGYDDNEDCNENGIPDGCEAATRLFWTEYVTIDRGCRGTDCDDDRVRSAFAEGTCDVRTPRDSEDNIGEIDIGFGPTTGLRMYWANQFRIRSSKLDGTCPKTEVNINYNGYGGLAVNSSANELYWTEIQYLQKGAYVWVYVKGVPRGGFNGTVVTSQEGFFPGGVAYDENSDTLFWAQQSFDFKGEIWAIKPHDAEPIAERIICRPGRTVRGIAVDPEAEHIYWIEWVGETYSKIRGADYAGEPIEPSPLVRIEDHFAENLAIDLQAETPKLYWTIPSSDLIMRSNLDGSSLETEYLPDVENPTGIAIIPQER